MKRRGLQLNRRHRPILHTVSLVLLLSGIFWAVLHHYDESGKVGERLRQMSPWLIAIHGFGAMIFVLLLGTLLVGHVRRAWHARKNRLNGAFFLAALTLLTLSGYALYYTGSENLRIVESNFHLWLGVAAPLLLFWHIRSGKNSGNRH